jgi:hypothetical protein
MYSAQNCDILVLIYHFHRRIDLITPYCCNNIHNIYTCLNNASNFIMVRFPVTITFFSSS